MKIHFLGAVESVTGSCFLLETGNHTILLDCGMFQGSEELEELNQAPLQFDPNKVDFMILSHVHIDHSGRIPLLVKRGFGGTVYCTRATADLAEIMLRDSGSIQESEAHWTNEHNKKKIKREIKGRKARKEALSALKIVKPLYTVEDAEKALKHLKGTDYDETIQLTETVSLRFQDAGHLLGSSIVEIWISEEDKKTKLVYSGDLGRRNKPILKDPSYVEEADFLLMEATYGDRLHEKMSESEERLKTIILETLRRGGNVVIPSFAVGRTQELIYLLNRYLRQEDEFARALLDTKVYVDSPMATSATEVFRKHPELFDDETKAIIQSGLSPLNFDNLDFTKTRNQSVALNYIEEPKIIISSSGMCEAGRIKHHLKHNLTDPDASVIFVGFQALGTLGRALKDGEAMVELFGEDVPVLAQVHSLEGLSGHGDYEELLEWLSHFKEQPRCTFLVHGEADAKIAFAERIRERLGWKCVKVAPQGTVDLDNQNEEFK